MDLSKDEKYLLEHENYVLVVCPICEQGNVMPGTDISIICSFCGRQIVYQP